MNPILSFIGSLLKSSVFIYNIKSTPAGLTCCNYKKFDENILTIKCLQINCEMYRLHPKARFPKSTIFSLYTRVCACETDMRTTLRRSLIIFSFLWVSVSVCVCVCVCVSVCVCVCVCVCNRDIPAAETWEGGTHKTLDSALSGDRGVLKCQNSNFLKICHSQSHTLTLCISLTQPNSLCCLHSYPLELASPPPPPLSSLSAVNTVSFSLSSIHKVPQGEIVSHTTVLRCHPLLSPSPLSPSFQTKHSLTPFTERQSKTGKRKKGREREGRVWESRAPPTFRRCSSPSLNCGPMRVAHSQLMQSFYNR